MSSLPAAVQVPPAKPAQVQLQDSASGNASTIRAPLASPGPALLAVMTYSTAVPAVAVVTPSVFVIERSAVKLDRSSASLSLALLLPGRGSVTSAGAVTVAVFVNVPVAHSAIAQVAVYATFAAAG